VSQSRLILLCVSAFGIAVGAWLLRSKEPARLPLAAPIHAAPATDVHPAPEPPSALARPPKAALPQAESPGERPASESGPATAFSRRQEFERNGYDAAGKSIDAALATLAGIMGRTEHAAFLRGMFMRLGESSSMEAVRALGQLPNGADRDTALAAFVEVSHAEPSGQENATPLAPPYGTNGSLILRLADHPDLAAGLARELIDGPALGQVLGRLAMDEVAQDPRRALSLGDGLNGDARSEFLGDFARGWAVADGSAAWIWALQQPDAALRESMQEAVIGGLAETDPLTASQRLAQLPAGPQREQALQEVGAQWAQSDTQAALNWAGSLPDPQDRAAALASIGNVAPVGIGAVLRTEPNGYPTIADVIPGGAASASPQLGPGTQIVSVRDAAGNVIDLQGQDLSTAVSLLRGAPNTPVTMVIIPSGGTPANLQTVVLTRRQLLYKR
jgi:hypothetical protein